MLGFLVGLAAVAAPVAAWLLATGRVAPPPPAPPAVAEAPRPSPPPPPEPALPPPGEMAPAGEAPAPPADPVAVEAAPSDTATGDPVETQVWRPFRSERAARGFAGHIAGRYGADARVERAGPGDYRVIVAAGTPEALEATLDRLRGEAGLARLEAAP